MNKFSSDQKIGLIVLFAVFLFGFTWLFLKNFQGHYADKGYRLCMHAVDPDIKDNHAPSDVVRACVNKYAGTQIELKGNNY